MKRFIFRVRAAAQLLAAAIFCFLLPVVMWPQTLQVTVGEPLIVDRYSGRETHFNVQAHHFCGLVRAGNGNLIALYSLLPDAPPPEGIRLEQYLRKSAGYRISSDGGGSWSAQRELDYAANNGGMLKSGGVLVPGFISEFVDAHQVRIRMHRSDDGGLNWTQYPEVRVRFPSSRSISLASEKFPRPASMYFYGRIMALDDGTLLTTMYGQFTDSQQFRSVLVRSRDEGRSWGFVSTIAGDKPSGHGGFTEPCLVRLKNQELLCVMRTEYHESRLLMQSRSRDGGASWTDPAPAPGIPGVRPADREYITPDGVRGHFDGGNVSPMLALLDNGVLALAYGRPGIKLALSAEGTGQRWDKIVEIVPKGYARSYGDADVTSGMTGLASIGKDRLMLISDIYLFRGAASDIRRNTVFARPIVVRK